ncbi:MAG: hypothetical protein GF334_10380 [Candidatus Altiarchaeales archaeon]|nr:hypothetical protein [Candidatus Altiarchaeales archaeon]
MERKIKKVHQIERGGYSTYVGPHQVHFRIDIFRSPRFIKILTLSGSLPNRDLPENPAPFLLTSLGDLSEEIIGRIPNFLQAIGKHQGLITGLDVFGVTGSIRHEQADIGVVMHVDTEHDRSLFEAPCESDIMGVLGLDLQVIDSGILENLTGFVCSVKETGVEGATHAGKIVDLVHVDGEARMELGHFVNSIGLDKGSVFHVMCLQREGGVIYRVT